MFEKLVSFTKKVSNLADKPALNPSELKAHFDAAPEELRASFNTLVDALNNDATTRLAIYAERTTALAVAKSTYVKFVTNGPVTGRQTTAWNGSRFTAPKTGVYQLNVFIGVLDMPQFGAIELYYYKNGTRVNQIDKQVAPGVTSLKVQSTLSLALNANEYVEFYVYSGAVTTFTDASGVSIAAITL